MKKLAILLLCGISLLACSRKPSEAPIQGVGFVSFWEGFDFGNKAMIDNPGVTEARFKDFCAQLSLQGKKERKAQVDTLLSRSEAGSEEMFLGFMELAEKHLSEPNSPLRNEESYILFLEYALRSGKTEEAYRERYGFQLKEAKKNRVGTKAADFGYITKDGTRGQMGKITSAFTLLYFNNPDCHDCKRVMGIMKASPTLAHLVASGELTILAVYPDEDLTSWEKHKEEFPSTWIVARYADGKEREKYSLPAIPSLYLLDRGKKVALKDAPIEQVEYYLRSKYNI